VTEDVGIARNTLRRVETGDVGVSMQAKLGTPTPAFDVNPDPDPDLAALRVTSIGALPIRPMRSLLSFSTSRAPA
jgi:hypothetical protein